MLDDVTLLALRNTRTNLLAALAGAPSSLGEEQRAACAQAALMLAELRELAISRCLGMPISR